MSDDEIEVVRSSLDIAYFRPNETIIARDAAPDSLYIVIKGAVEERDGDDLVALRGPGDTFDSRALVQGRGANVFVAREETLCNLLPRDITLRLINQNPRFASFFYLDIAHKLDAVSREEEGARFAPLLGARVGRSVPAPGGVHRGERTIAEAGALMRRNKSYALFVRGRGGRHRHPHRPPERDDPRPPTDRKSGRRRWRTGLSSAWSPTISSRPRSSR